MNKTENPNEELGKLIGIRINYNLMTEIKKFIEIKKNSGNFKYSGITDFTRKALIAYLSNEIEPDYTNDPKGRKSSFTLLLNNDLEELYNSFPENSKNRMIVSCIKSSYKKEQMNNQNKTN